MAIDADEVDRGLVLHLSPERLLADGAKVECPVRDRIVEDDHFFLCLGVDDTHGDWTPAYKNPGDGRVEIQPSMKTGHPKWTGISSYVHREQVWSFSHAVASAAAIAGKDQSKKGSRNRVVEAGIPEM